MPQVHFRDTSCPTLLSDIELITRKLHISSIQGSCPDAARRKLMIAAKKLVSELEPPEDALGRIVQGVRYTLSPDYALVNCITLVLTTVSRV